MKDFEGLSLEKQMELMSEVVHNHSNEINEIDSKCYRAFSMVEDDLNMLTERENTIDMKLAHEIDDIHGSLGSVALWTTFGILATGALAFFGYNAWTKHEERIEKLEKFSRMKIVFPKTEADDTVENPKMA